MPDPHDERLSLPIEQGVLLWAMRSLVMEMRRPSGLDGRVDDMLDRFGAPRVAPYLKGFMFALSHGAARMINVQCVCCNRIGDDERALLAVLGLAQAMRPFEALLALHSMVTPAGARAALQSAEGLGTVLAEAGRFLPAPDEEVSHYALATASNAAFRPANCTLH